MIEGQELHTTSEGPSASFPPLLRHYFLSKNFSRERCPRYHSRFGCLLTSVNRKCTFSAMLAFSDQTLSHQFFVPQSSICFYSPVPIQKMPASAFPKIQLPGENAGRDTPCETYTCRGDLGVKVRQSPIPSLMKVRPMHQIELLQLYLCPLLLTPYVGPWSWTGQYERLCPFSGAT